MSVPVSEWNPAISCSVVATALSVQRHQCQGIVNIIIINNNVTYIAKEAANVLLLVSVKQSVSLLLKVVGDVSVDHRSCGKWILITGPWTAKLWSPYTMFEVDEISDECFIHLAVRSVHENYENWLNFIRVIPKILPAVLFVILKNSYNRIPKVVQQRN